MQAEAGTLIISLLKNNEERRKTMKKFETPEIEIAKFNVADVITTSGDTRLPDDDL